MDRKYKMKRLHTSAVSELSMECNFAKASPERTNQRDPDSRQRLTSKYIITEDASHATRLLGVIEQHGISQQSSA